MAESGEILLVPKLKRLEGRQVPADLAAVLEQLRSTMDRNGWFGCQLSISRRPLKYASEEGTARVDVQLLQPADPPGAGAGYSAGGRVTAPGGR